MHARRIVHSAAAIAFVFSFASLARAAETFKVDPAHSQIIFKINHMGVSNIYGRFNDVNGTMTLDNDDPTKSSFEVEVQAKNIDTGVPKRDDHLRSPDFFNVKQFPTINFKSTGVKKIDDNNYEVTGDLSLHGETKSITVKLEKIGEKDIPQAGGLRAGVGTTFTIKRSDFGMNFMPGGVGEEVTLMINLEGLKK
jgi:polyisoprenoid-binding protein YceI